MKQDDNTLKTPRTRSAKVHVPPAPNDRPTGSTRQNVAPGKKSGEYTDRGQPPLEKK